MLQELRDPLTLGLTLFTTPFFIFFFWLLWGQTPIIHVGVFLPKIRSEAIELTAKNFDGIYIKHYQTKEDLIVSIEKKEVDITIFQNERGPTSNPKKVQIEIQNHKGSEIYDRVVYLLSDAIKNEILDANDTQIIVKSKMQQDPKKNSEFKNFVPGFLVFSIIMIVFSTTMMLAFEIESNLIFRYKISNTSVHEYMIGSGSIQFLNAAVSILISITLTHFLGFAFYGNFLLVFLTCLLGALSMIGLGLLLASFHKNSSQAFLGSSFVMFLLLLFSGILFPKPNVTIRLGESLFFNLFDLLPTSILKQVIDGILLQKESIIEIKEGLFMLLVSSLFYFTLGILFFRRVFQKGGET